MPLLVFPNLTPGKALPLALANSTIANVTHTEACKALAALQNHGLSLSQAAGGWEANPAEGPQANQPSNCQTGA